MKASYSVPVSPSARANVEDLLTAIRAGSRSAMTSATRPHWSGSVSGSHARGKGPMSYRATASRSSGCPGPRSWRMRTVRLRAAM